MIFLGALILLAIGAVYAVAFVGRRDRRHPEGPPTLPILGNLHQMPTRRAHLKLTEWAKQYGGLYSLKLGSGTAIVITDRRLVKQLIDKKSSIYSNRPVSTVTKQITGDDHVLIMPYGDLWRQYRKLIHQYFMEAVVEKQHLALVDAEGAQMMRDFCEEPEKYMLHPKRYSNSIIMSCLYGMRTPRTDTPHMTRLYDLMEDWSYIQELGNTPPIDIYPWLKLIPERFLNMWDTRSRTVGKQMNSLYNEYLQIVINRRKDRGSRDCFVDRMLEQKDKLGFTRHQQYFLPGTLMEGGSDTTASITTAFIHAMTKFPEVQRKAQEEIDAVVGEDRSPVWSDYEKLPYVAALVKEAHRWRPVTPLGFPHSVAEDDWIDGKLIPKDSLIFINAFGMQHDPQRFPNPEVFDPDHFKGITALAPELAAASDPELRDHWGYGAGRRLCPGVHLAERNLFLGMAKILWAFDIQKGKDAHGNPIEPDVSNETGYSAGFLVCANPFAAEIKVRSEERKKTIMREFKEAEATVFSKYE